MLVGLRDEDCSDPSHYWTPAGDAFQVGDGTPSATVDAPDAMDCAKVLMRSTAPGLEPQVSQCRTCSMS